MTELKAITVYFNERQVKELKEYKAFVAESGSVISTSEIIREVMLEWLQKQKRHNRFLKAKRDYETVKNV